MSRRLTRSWSMMLALSLMAVPGAVGQQAQFASRGPRFLLASWPTAIELDASSAPVLRKRVSLDLIGSTIGQALKEITRQADLEISYSPGLIPIDQPVTVRAQDITVAAALTEVLEDVPVDVSVTVGGELALVRRTRQTMTAAPVDTGDVAGRVTDRATGAPLAGATLTVDSVGATASTSADGRYRIIGLRPGTYLIRARYVGYTPASLTVVVTADHEVAADFSLQRLAQELDQVVVTGTIVPTEVRALPTPVSVRGEPESAQQRPRTVQALLRQAVPGAVSWDQVNNPFYTALSVRGASTLSGFVGQMKVFVDGIEIANPSNAAVDPSSIEQVEVIRGPQAAAIYGSDAIGGVVQIFTKRGTAMLPRPQLDADAALGTIRTPYAGFGSVLRQKYEASVRGASSEVSYNLGAGYSRTGDYLPNGELSAQSNPSVYGGMRFGRGMVTVDLSARHYTQNNPAVLNPGLSQTGYAFFSRPFRQDQQVRSLTVGGRLTVATTEWWRQNVTLGVDNLVSKFEYTQPRRVTPEDTLLAVSELTRTKMSIGFNTSLQGPVAPHVSASAVLGVDHWSLPYSQFGTSGALTTTGAIQVAPDYAISASRTTTTNTGYFAQAQLGFREVLYLTGGLRAEQNSDFGDRAGTPLSPRVGLSYAPSAPLLGKIQLKLRTSWGRAIRAPSPGYKSESGQGTFDFRVANPALGPERQRGWDAGADLVFGRRGTLSMTYYDQTAEDLIQVVQLQSTAVPTSQAQNVGQVKNRGVELEGRLSIGPLALRGQYAYTKARIERLAADYQGDLRVGDQTLLTPKHTAGGSGALAPYAGMTISAGVTFVGSWKDYDYLAEFRCFAGTDACRQDFRDYFVSYPAFVKLNASVFQQITPFVAGFLSVDNLTDNNTYEVNNLYPVMGRIVTIGAHFRY
jgi:outer membrane receptor protein involved in Fe transport